MSDFMIIGELYLVKEYFWLLFPTKETVPAQHSLDVVAFECSSEAHQEAIWYSAEFNCNLPVIEENTYVVLLEQYKDHFKILDLNGNIGWIRCDDFSNYFEIVKQQSNYMFSE